MIDLLVEIISGALVILLAYPLWLLLERFDIVDAEDAGEMIFTMAVIIVTSFMSQYMLDIRYIGGAQAGAVIAISTTILLFFSGFASRIDDTDDQDVDEYKISCTCPDCGEEVNLEIHQE